MSFPGTEEIIIAKNRHRFDFIYIFTSILVGTIKLLTDLKLKKITTKGVFRKNAETLQLN